MTLECDDDLATNFIRSFSLLLDFFFLLVSEMLLICKFKCSDLAGRLPRHVEGCPRASLPLVSYA